VSESALDFLSRIGHRIHLQVPFQTPVFLLLEVDAQVSVGLLHVADCRRLHGFCESREVLLVVNVFPKFVQQSGLARKLVCPVVEGFVRLESAASCDDLTRLEVLGVLLGSFV